MIPPTAPVSDGDTEAAQDPARPRHRRRVASRRRRAASGRRGLEIAGLVLGIAAGMGVAAAWLVPALHHLAGPPPVNSPAVVVHDSSGAFPLLQLHGARAHR